MSERVSLLPLPLRRWLAIQVLLLLTALLAWPAWAQPAPDERLDDRDPPTRVARVAELQGPVFWYDAEQRDWQPLLRNQTLAEGDRLRVGERGRVGLRIGAHAFWLDERSELELRRLDDDRIDFDLERGALALRWLSREAAQEAQVRTREGRFGFERAGAYRIDQLSRASRGQTFEGRLRFDHRGDDGAALFVEAGEQAELWWEGGPRAERGRASRGDDFGDWLVASLGFGRQDVASLRDRPAYRYVSPELTGADELDNYGRWETTAEFGPIWFPLRVAVDWAPYRHGRWTWTRHWGWTWVDELPWGYATSHYGRWVHWRGRWCWTPGAVLVPRPVFAPALVAWVGSGSVQIGVQIGGRYHPPVAWVPLAPYERYRPWYRHGQRYQQRIDPDPITVRRPHQGQWVGHNRAVPGAVSTIGRVAEGAAQQAVMRPVPLRDEQALRALQPLPQAPTRQQAREVGLPLVQSPRVAEEPPRLRAGGGAGLQGGDGREAQLPLRESRPTPPAAEPQRPAQGFELPTRDNAREDPRDRVRDPARDERQERLRREREQGDERGLPWRRPEMPVQPQPQPRPEMPRIEPQRPAELPIRRIEVPRAEPPRQEAPRRVEPPRAEPPRQEAPPRRGRDDDGPRRGNEALK